MFRPIPKNINHLLIKYYKAERSSGRFFDRVAPALVELMAKSNVSILRAVASYCRNATPEILDYLIVSQFEMDYNKFVIGDYMDDSIAGDIYYNCADHPNISYQTLKKLRNLAFSGPFSYPVCLVRTIDERLDKK